MAKLSALDPNRALRGKVGGLVYSVQSDGSTTVRTVGSRKVPFTSAEKQQQERLRHGHPYAALVAMDPQLCEPYQRQADLLGERLCDVIMRDYLTDPIVAGIDSSSYLGQPGDPILVITGDDFKVVRVSVLLRDQQGHRVERGEAVPANGCAAKVWVYRATESVPAGTTLTIEARAFDRASHSDSLTVTHQI